MATKIFDVGQMECEDVQAWVKSVKFSTKSGSTYTPAVVDDGAFVLLGDYAPDTTYANEKDWNVKYAYAPTAATFGAEDVFVIDISDVSAGVIAGNTYKIGSKLVDLQVQAGYPVRARALKKGDKFWLGEGCFESVPTVGEFANLTAGKVTLTPADEVTDGQLNLAIVASKPMTIGTLVSYSGSRFEQEYLVEVL